MSKTTNRETASREGASVDDRLAPGTAVLGVSSRGSDPVAFPVEDTVVALAAGTPVESAGVRVVLDGGGLAAVDAADGTPLPSYQANWLSWSQFHPGTQTWAR